jgi:predicted metal-binding membrane protein
VTAPLVAPTDAPARRQAAPHRPVGVAVGVAAAAAGAALVGWQLSPAADRLGHGSGADGASAAAMAGWFTASWLLMTVATMLPASLPLLSAFRRLLGDRRDAARLVAAVVAGYLAVWTSAGLVLSAVDAGVHEIAAHTPLRDHGPAALAATLLVAGAYQLSETSARCLRACRSPFSFLATRWGAGSALARAARIGVDHGVSCLGCCAALMVVMLAVGMANPFAMLGLGGVAALHKQASWGVGLARLTGGALVAAAVVVAAVHLGAPLAGVR